jgi:hypothetical protein
MVLISGLHPAKMSRKKNTANTLFIFCGFDYSFGFILFEKKEIKNTQKYGDYSDFQLLKRKNPLLKNPLYSPEYHNSGSF